MGLKEVRMALTRPKISQEALARKANLTLQTYRRAETRGSIKYSTGKMILDALNEVLKERSMNTVTIADLDLNLE